MARILVVEDNPQNLKLTTVILEAGGHTVTAAHDADEAEKELVPGRVPDLIIMDLALPGKDGYMLTKELRQRTDTARLPILAVSSFAMPGDAERAISAGCTQYLTKPVRRAILLERVETLLAGAGISPPSASKASTGATSSSESPPSDRHAATGEPADGAHVGAEEPPSSPDPTSPEPAAADPVATPPTAPPPAAPVPSEGPQPSGPPPTAGSEPPTSAGLGP
ncbi:MAG: response regulator [Thermoplasmata archaeon]